MGQRIDLTTMPADRLQRHALELTMAVGFLHGAVTEDSALRVLGLTEKKQFRNLIQEGVWDAVARATPDPAPEGEQAATEPPATAAPAEQEQAGRRRGKLRGGLESDAT